MGGTLDFLVIGAQRSGTTSLWRHLADHPEIYIPTSKEAPFFSHDEPFGRGLEWYLGEFFPDADRARRWGTVSPHYMMGSPDADVAEVARRIHATVPAAKLIAVLRDPIERAQSHHRMVVHRGRETRGFDEAALESLEPEMLERARREPPTVQPYLVQGEYGRIVGDYLAVFPRESLHLLLSSELAHNPLEALRSIFAFLGVDEAHRPRSPHERHHRGGRARRLSADAERQLKEHLAREVWPATRRPAQQRRAFDYWFMQWNVIPDDAFEPIDPRVRRKLEQHFARDGELLEALTGVRAPWSVERH